MVRIVMGFYFTLRLMQMVVPFVFGALRQTVWLMVTGGAGFWSGVPKVVNRIADEWTARACAAGIATKYDSRLYRVMQFTAFLTFLTGWILSSYLTVWIINRLIF